MTACRRCAPTLRAAPHGWLRPRGPQARPWQGGEGALPYEEAAEEQSRASPKSMMRTLVRSPARASIRFSSCGSGHSGGMSAPAPSAGLSAAQERRRRGEGARLDVPVHKAAAVDVLQALQDLRRVRGFGWQRCAAPR